MSLTPSNMISLGTTAPDFNLVDVTTDTYVSLSEHKGNVGTLIMFICNHCPYVKHVNSTLSSLANQYNGDDIGFLAISSNDIINYPDDSPENMKKQAIENKFN